MIFELWCDQQLLRELPDFEEAKLVAQVLADQFARPVDIFAPAGLLVTIEPLRAA